MLRRWKHTPGWFRMVARVTTQTTSQCLTAITAITAILVFVCWKPSTARHSMTQCKLLQATVAFEGIFAKLQTQADGSRHVLTICCRCPCYSKTEWQIDVFQQCFNILGGHHRGMFRHEGAKGEDEGMNMYELYIIESKSHIIYTSFTKMAIHRYFQWRCCSSPLFPRQRVQDFLKSIPNELTKLAGAVNEAMQLTDLATRLVNEEVKSTGKKSVDPVI